MITRSRCIAVLTTAAVALSGVAGASASTKTHASGTTSHATAAKTMVASKAKNGTGVVKPIKAGTVVAAISAFPTGGKGSGTEATCSLWSDRLQEEQDAQDNATDKQDVIDTTNALNSDVDNALSAGCAVIF